MASDKVFAKAALETGTIIVIEVETARIVFDALGGLECIGGLTGKTDVFWAVEDTVGNCAFGAFAKDCKFVIGATCKACLT